jgi:hypothetical protein
VSIEVTGNDRIDTATAEIAMHIRDGRIGSHTRWREQDHYDEATRLRDEIMAGAVAELRQALFDICIAAGADMDGERQCPPPGVFTPDIPQRALEAVKELRRNYDETEAP